MFRNIIIANSKFFIILLIQHIVVGLLISATIVKHLNLLIFVLRIWYPTLNWNKTLYRKFIFQEQEKENLKELSNLFDEQIQAVVDHIRFFSEHLINTKT